MLSTNFSNLLKTVRMALLASGKEWLVDAPWFIPDLSLERLGIFFDDLHRFKRKFQASLRKWDFMTIEKKEIETPMSRAVIKFSSKNCGICYKMSFYDEKVTNELELDFVNVKMQDTATYGKYRKILLAQYPDKSAMGWPTYLVCEAPESDDFRILGEVKGGHPKGEFRNKLQAVLAAES